MNKLFLTVFVFSFAIIAAAPSLEEKNQGNLGSKSAQILFYNSNFILRILVQFLEFKFSFPATLCKYCNLRF